jgi:hypothetical protein
MRILFGLSLGLTAAAALTGCGKSEASVKQEVREKALANCKTQGAAQAASIPGVNIDNFCGCLVDKIMEGRSVDELAKMNTPEGLGPQVGQQAAMQCISTQMPGMMQGAGAPPAGAAAPAATGATTADNASDTADTE